jgi:hypothetical protein
MNEMDKKVLLAKLEGIIGNSCYNGNIQNWGPGYTKYSDGREFRYPITFLENGVTKDKCWRTDPSMAFERMKTGYYAFGANRLNIIEALEEIVDYLEENHGLTGTTPSSIK